MDLFESLARGLVARQNIHATMATDSMEHLRESVCTAEFGMAVYLLANVSPYSTKVLQP